MNSGVGVADDRRQFGYGNVHAGAFKRFGEIAAGAEHGVRFEPVAVEALDG